MTRADLIGKIDDVLRRGGAAWSRDDMGTTELQKDAATCLLEAHRQLMAAPIRPVATYLRAFLRDLEAAVPPPQGGHHSLTYAQHGQGSQWSERLVLSVTVGGRRATLFLDDEDFNQAADGLAAAAVQELRRLAAGSAPPQGAE